MFMAVAPLLRGMPILAPPHSCSASMCGVFASRTRFVIRFHLGWLGLMPMGCENKTAFSVSHSLSKATMSAISHDLCSHVSNAR